MSREAWIYVALVSILAIGLIGISYAVAPMDVSLPTFFAFLILTIIAQLYKESAPNHQSYHLALVFLMAGLLLLNPWLFAILVIVPHLVEWVKERLVGSRRLRNWYKQPFNIAVHIIAGNLAYHSHLIISTSGNSWAGIASALALVVAAIVYLLVNHLLIGIALALAQGVSLKQSGILEWGNLGSDLTMLLLGTIVAVLWRLNPWLVLPGLAPLVTIYQALKIPLLKKQATTDDKTGLWNAGHFAQLFSVEMKRSARFNRPLAFIMADLDLLRNINNTYGHLAGDAVLAQIGQIVRESIREYDIAGRFGGEEFAIALPETEAAEARDIAERIRSAVQRAQFDVPTSSLQIQTTMSFGFACYPINAISPMDLIHQADLAVYQAKLKGRNCIVSADEVPLSVKADKLTHTDRVSSLYAPTFEPRPTPTV